MSITAHCPKCGEVSTRLDKYAGTSVTCDCGETFTIPQHNVEAVDAFAPDEAPAPPEEIVPRPDRVAEFHRTLAQLTPHVYMTPILLGVNVLVFVLMVATGVSLTDPTIPDLLRWGANFGPKTISGEWWRLLTCMFVHIGIIHLLCNMYALAVAGLLVERMIGNVGFLVLYLVAGLCGSLASVFWNPILVSAGASGAVFGVFGALLGLLVFRASSVPPKALTQFRNSGVVLIGYNLVYGMMQPNIDMAAHIGGLAAGFLGGLVLSQSFTPEARAGRPLRNAALGGLGALLVLGGAIGLANRNPDLANVLNELDHFAAVEKKVLDAYNGALTRAQRQELTDTAFADLMERDVLPDWRAARERLSALRNVPEPLQGNVVSVLDYMRVRQEAWEIFVQALREGNEQKFQQAAEKQKLADAAALRSTNGGGR